jgi:hypothetical protein
VLEYSITGSAFWDLDDGEIDLLVIVKDTDYKFKRLKDGEFDIIIIREDFMIDILEFKVINPMTKYNVFHLFKKPEYRIWDYDYYFEQYKQQYIEFTDSVR